MKHQKPESKIDAVIENLECEAKIDITKIVAEGIIEAFDDVEIWPDETSAGFGVFASMGELWANDDLNTVSKTVTLKEIIRTHYIYDDDSGWTKAEALGKELKILSDQLFKSAAIGKKKWPNEKAE